MQQLIYQGTAKNVTESRQIESLGMFLAAAANGISVKILISKEGIMRRLILLLCLAAIMGLSTISSAALINNGDGLIYDSDLNITWLQEANNSGMTWQQARDWASGLTAGGVNGWRLPSTADGESVIGFDGTTTAGANVTTSEMGHLFFTELGNKSFLDVNGNPFQPGWGLVNKGPFTNLQPWIHFSGTEYGTDSSKAWGFDFLGGIQETFNKDAVNFYALAVHSGNVAPVAAPEPATMLLLGLGLVGLAGVRRKFQN